MSKKDKELKKLEALANKKKFEKADKDKKANTVGTRMEEKYHDLMRKFNKLEAKYGLVDGKVDDPKKEVLLGMKKGGGVLKDVPEGNTGLGKLPTPVRNKMGFRKAGGLMKYKKGGKVKAKTKPKTTKKFRGDGIARKGKTKGRMI